jgi:hypothetical protein
MAITQEPQVSSGETFTSTNPATGEVVGTFAVDGPEQVILVADHLDWAARRAGKVLARRRVETTLLAKNHAACTRTSSASNTSRIRSGVGSSGCSRATSANVHRFRTSAVRSAL